MNFLFWNTACKNLSREVRLLVNECSSDFILLAEAEDHEYDYLVALNKRRKGSLFAKVPAFVPGTSRLVMFSRLPPGEMSPAAEDHTCSVLRVSPAGSKEFILACVHLSSPMHMEHDDRAGLAGCTARMIGEVEKAAGHARTLVIGDFNMNPFETGMVSSEGFHAVLDRRVAERKHRTVQRRQRRFFYNPMWRFMNDERRPSCGSHFYQKSKPLCHFWNTLDQVLIRPELLTAFDDTGLNLLTTIGRESLLDDKGRPNKLKYSDHLPIRLNLNL